jgi:fucose 4-O-acetylase-like acetyltransferase
LDASAGVAVGAVQMEIERAIYLFHMPLFFVLSGLVFRGIGPGVPVRHYLTDRAGALLWPLLVWTYVIIAAQVVGQGGSNADAGWSNLLVVPIPPYSLMWFLWALFLVHLIAAPLRGRRPAVLLAVGIAGMVAAPALSGRAEELFAPALGALLPFVIGMAARNLRARASAPVWIAAPGAFALTQMLDAAGAVPGEIARSALMTAAALAACVAIASLPIPQGGTLVRVLRRLGRWSMAIYLSHVIFAGAMRAALLVAGVSGQWLHLALGVMAGCAGPCAMILIARRFGLERALGLGLPPRPGLKPAARAAR